MPIDRAVRGPAADAWRSRLEVHGGAAHPLDPPDSFGSSCVTLSQCYQCPLDISTRLSRSMKREINLSRSARCVLRLFRKSIASTSHTTRSPASEKVAGSAAPRELAATRKQFGRLSCRSAELRASLTDSRCLVARFLRPRLAKVRLDYHIACASHLLKANLAQRRSSIRTRSDDKGHVSLKAFVNQMGIDTNADLPVDLYKIPMGTTKKFVWNIMQTFQNHAP